MAAAALQRILIRTHHMTSRKKILAITKAAQRFSCAVVLKTGRGPPGVMLAEGEGEGAREWLEVVRKLRYKDFHLVKREVVLRRGLVGVEPGEVRELTSLRDLGALLQEEGNAEMYEWWRVHMGYKKGG
ncbi:hypothetical protein MBM_00752 [Drepanopeziza brunnea f. sp. 'multigermtubi' MB_m1]|uniref:Uncharacterized protein n=1 Tax=Marssonina brunnea f. sp. multigermtubi (strain MB_m1) TaxID=1072389 RepID=K1Y945_MARBU|nr:uncharacterized protein MBM_00752 [Drepanopeziza brunnea f. sp. 'multigermtubi' MB_m1]EKD21639.1 hypothetical protein MBM_00752 [Drepanopeziza brunnea f. sp. 'multigermtubi' MB_m1]